MASPNMRMQPANQSVIKFATTESLAQVQRTVEEWRTALATLDSIERERFATAVTSGWNHYQNMFYQYDKRFLDAELHQSQKIFVARNSPLWIALGFSTYGDTRFDRFVRASAEKTSDA